jgi:hypothetical protein
VSARIETISVVLIAAAVLVGGRSLLGSFVQHHVAAMLVLSGLLVLQFLALRRNYAEGGPAVRIRATRDAAFLAAVVLALILVASPQRWSIGATIVALEFGFILDLLARFSPDPIR